MLSKIHDLLIERPMSATEIAEFLGVSYPRALSLIWTLKRTCIISLDSKSGRYEIGSQGDKSLNHLLSFVKDDALAATYQSLGQYRVEIIKIINTILESENNGR